MGRSFKLTYFQARGRGEWARLLFALAGQDFEDCAFVRSDWPALKPNTPPFHTVPVLDVTEADGRTWRLAQSTAICKYLADEFGLAGTTAEEKALALMYVEGTSEMYANYQAVIAAFVKGDVPGIKKAGTEFTNNFVRGYAKRYEGFLGGNTWLVGDQMTWADVYVAEYLNRFTRFVPDYLDDTPKLKAYVGRFHELPAVKKRVQQRPADPNKSEFLI